MTNSTVSPGRQFLDAHVEAIVAGNIDEMVDRDYTEDAVFISFFNGFDTPPPITIKGREGINFFFHEYMSVIGTIDVKSIDFTEFENAIFYQTTFNCNLGLATAGVAWTMQDGKIAYHFGFWV